MECFIGSVTKVRRTQPGDTCVRWPGLYTCTWSVVGWPGLHVYIHVHVHGVSWVRAPPEAAHFFLGKVTALGVLCCFVLFVCLTLLASFFLLISHYIHVHDMVLSNDRRALRQYVRYWYKQEFTRLMKSWYM